jgi:hypothetical protein
MEAMAEARTVVPSARAVPGEREERLHRIMLGVVFFWACAIYVDARHHAYDGFRIESFLIPEHVPLYSGWLAACAVLGIYYLQSVRQGLPLSMRLPSSYWLVAVGAIAYGLAGGFDLLWHATFGFEQNLAVTWSPSHLALVASKLIVVAGVLRYSLDHRIQDDTSSLKAALPLLIPVAVILWEAMWTTWYSNPLTADYASGGALVGQLDAFDHLEYGAWAAAVAGTLGMLWNVAILVPFLIVPLARWRLPVGSITLVVALYSVIMAAVVDTWIYLPAFLGGAILGDVVWAWVRRSGRTDQPLAYAAIGVVVPLGQGIGYFAAVALLPLGIIWPVHLWAGVLVMSAAVGGWLGYVATGSAASPSAGS